MDEFNEFFNFSPNAPTPERPLISAGYVNGRIVADNIEVYKEPVKREKYGTEYAKKYKQAESERLIKVF